MRLVARYAPALTLCLTTACAGTGVPRLLAFPDPEIRPARNIGDIEEYGTAAASVLQAVGELGFESFPLVFQFCPDTHAFQATLLESGYDRTLARDTARTMDAVGGYRRVVINERALARQPWPSRVAMLAHEVGHSIQYEWGGGQRGASDQWLREGFAEWLAMQVVSRLHGIGMPEARRRYREILRRKTPSPDHAPALNQMVTFRQWVTLGQNENSTQYAQAFLCVDFLIDRHGLPAVVKYFRSFARSNDRAGNFHAAFGEDLAAFSTVATAHVWSLH
jgi:hypothetical protein